MYLSDLTHRNAINSADNLLSYGIFEGESKRVCTVKLQDQISQTVLGATTQPLDVTTYYVTDCGDDVYSLVLRYPERADIIISEERSKCWRRFCKAKELCHLFTDCEDTFSYDSHDLMDAVKLGRNVELGNPDEEMNPEAFAFYLALEIMIPLEARETIARQEAENQDPFLIAQLIRVPEALLRTYFLNGSKYKKCSAALRANPA